MLAGNVSFARAFAQSQVSLAEPFQLTSVGNIINLSPATNVSNCLGPSHSLTTHFRVDNNLKYWFENRVGFTTHGPSNPLRSAWHRPRVCAPERATISCERDEEGGWAEVQYQEITSAERFEYHVSARARASSPDPNNPSDQTPVSNDPHQVLHPATCSSHYLLPRLPPLPSHNPLSPPSKAPSDLP